MVVDLSPPVAGSSEERTDLVPTLIPQILASQTFWGDHVYRFTLGPGSYFVSTVNLTPVAGNDRHWPNGEG